MRNIGTFVFWALVVFLFDGSFRPSVTRIAGLWVSVVALTVVIGLANSRGVLGRRPLAVLREVAE